MERLHHPNIVKVIGSEVRRHTGGGDTAGVEILVLMELCPGGHLLTRLNQLKEQKRALPFAKVVEVFLQIVRPIAYMHAMAPPHAHRDLKFENILVAGDGTLRLCDFGSSSTHEGAVRDKMDRAEQEDAILRYTTPHFRAPEMCDLFSGQPLDARTDVWVSC
jgi:serine/threonine protein kinase